MAPLLFLSVIPLSLTVIEQCPSLGYVSGPANVRIIAFSDGTAFWRENRNVELAEGVNHLEFSDIPLTIDRPGVIIRSVSEPENFKVLETTFSSPPKPDASGSREAASPPASDRNEPRAKMLAAVMTSKPGRHECELLYRAKGLSVTPGYIALLGPGSTMDLKGLAGIHNACGVPIKNAAVYLPVEGYTQRGTSTTRSEYYSRRSAVSSGGAVHSSLQLIPTPVSIEPGQTKDYELAYLWRVSFDKTNLYDGLPIGVSIPRPTRDYNSSRRNRGFSIQTANANVVKVAYILDTAPFEVPQSGLTLAEVQLYRFGARSFTFEPGILNFDRQRSGYEIITGPHPALVGARKQVDFRETNRGDDCTETIEVTVQNNSSKPQKVAIHEHLLRSDKYNIEKGSHAHIEIRPGLIEFRVEVGPQASSRVEYTVQYEY